MGPLHHSGRFGESVSAFTHGPKLGPCQLVRHAASGKRATLESSR
jgi:hypothetical protein